MTAGHVENEILRAAQGLKGDFIRADGQTTTGPGANVRHAQAGVHRELLRHRRDGLAPPKAQAADRQPRLLPTLLRQRRDQAARVHTHPRRISREPSS